VAQLHDEHLTTEQLSASFDKQLSPQEQAIFDAHMSTCQQCKLNLADLRLTVALLHAIPEEKVPHSFVLSSSLTTVPDRTIRQDTTLTPIPQRQRTRISTLRRSIRVVSTLAAVLALFFIISGILSLTYVGKGSSASTATSYSSSGEASTVHSAVSTPGIHGTTNDRPQERTATATPTPVPTHTLTPNGTATTKASSGTPKDQGSTVQPVLDPGQPAGRLSLGGFLLALSIIGLIITRRRRVAVN
jgi:hypothetical protein